MIRIRKRGSLVCSKCGEIGQFALWEGGVCRQCWVPGEVGAGPLTTGPAVLPPVQSRESLDLQDRCDSIRLELELSRSAFALHIGVKMTMFNRWMKGDCKEVGQQRMNQRVEAALVRMELMDAEEAVA